MTIAACYLSSEGIVFGADSTTTVLVPLPDLGPERGTPRYYNHSQKVFPVGANGTLALVTWGLGNLGPLSYRTLVARFAATLDRVPPTSVLHAAERWSDLFWAEYQRELASVCHLVQTVQAAGTATPEETRALRELVDRSTAGFCLGGYLLPDRTPAAYELLFDATLQAGPQPIPLPLGQARFWGQSGYIARIQHGLDEELFEGILGSGHWTGSRAHLAQLVAPYQLREPHDLPLGAAIDWIYSGLFLTIQTVRYSHLAPTCGGPIHIGVVTTDRPFHWVRDHAPDSTYSP